MLKYVKKRRNGGLDSECYLFFVFLLIDLLLHRNDVIDEIYSEGIACIKEHNDFYSFKMLTFFLSQLSETSEELSVWDRKYKYISAAVLHSFSLECMLLDRHAIFYCILLIWQL